MANDDTNPGIGADNARDMLDVATSVFPIVGIGASAGGLDAYKRLLSNLPADTGMAFVLIQHLHPDFPSQLSEILSRSTSMPVVEVSDEPEVKPNTVYVIPPGRSMVLDKYTLNLHPRSMVRRLHRPVDEFLRSLAEFHGNSGIGVILSGTGADGSEGMEEIKAEGGITFAQDSSAQYDGMPNAAISAGCVDFVLSPEEIARELVRISAHPYVMTRSEARAQEGDNLVQRILRLVHDSTGVDFSNYKSTTLQRRLTRRMLLQGMDNPEQYLRFLRATPREVQDLYRDFLINVTRFFRDPESFEVLSRTVFPELFRNRAPDQPIRVWVLGCATGEEAYSIAIGLHEFAEREHSPVPIQVFATDLSDKGIDWARAGLYSRDIANYVSPERLERYFDKNENGYRIGKLIREMCVFARQNVLSDPPFSRMDLISCRNLLIYLEPILQQRVMPLFHYALNPNSYLWLGSAETVGSFDNLFEVRDSRHRIYQARGVQPALLAPLQAAPPALGSRAATSPIRLPDPAPLRDPVRDADRVLLSRYVPAAVLVNLDGDVVQFRGDTGPFLLMGGGRPSLNVYKMAREGLLVPLRETVQRARQSGVPISSLGSTSDGNGILRQVDIDVLPVPGETHDQLHFLIVFRFSGEALPQGASVVQLRPRTAETDNEELEHARNESARLVQELHATRDYLHALLEQRDATNEELQSANEEAQSANEELQSINEELQTTKEEMESANEELLSVNEELSNRHEQLSKANDDLSNVVASTEMAMVTVGPDLRIRRFTPAAQSLFSLISSDVGRPLGDLKLSFGMEDIEHALFEVMRELPVPDRDVRDRRGRWLSLRIRPYRASGGQVDGAVLVLVDIDQQKRSEASSRDSQRKLSLLMEGGTGISIVILDREGRISGWNAGAERLFQYSEGEIHGKPFSTLYSGADAAEYARMEMDSAIAKESVHEESAMRRRDGSVFWSSGVLTVLRDEDSQVLGFAKVISDVSGRHRIEQERHAAEQRKDEFLSILAHELRNPLAPIRSSLHLLDNPRLDEAGAQHARGVIKRQVNHMVRLIDDLLDVARIAKGKIEFRPEPLDLASVIETAVQSVRDIIDSSRQVLSVQLPQEPLLLYADHARLAQAVSNLLINAARYTQDGGHIALTVQARPDEYRIVVADDGIGIAAEKQQEVFELFAQAGHVDGRAKDGLGIGLTMVRMLVEMHGGQVHVDSQGLGSGSVFTIVLPRQTRFAEREEQARELLAPGRRILLVDDNRDGADTLAAALRLQGQAVEVAYDGESGLELAQKSLPEFAIIDLGLPGIDGHELARRIRESAWGKSMLLVAYTGWAQEEDRRASARAGMDAHLTKPVDPEQLSAALFEIERARASRAD